MDSTLEQWFNKVNDWLNEQVFWQQLRAKWDELDPQSKLYLKITAGGLCGIVILLTFMNFIWAAHRLRDDVAEKSEILTMIQNSTDELRHLKDMSANLTGAESADPWPTYFETLAGNAGVSKDGFTVSEPKPGASSEVTKEALFDLGVKHASIRHIVKFAQSLESGARPVKLRNLTIDTIPDGTGYLDATLAVSAFSLVPANK